MPDPSQPSSSSRNLPAAFVGGGVIGTLGGLIGLGGAEFRLPRLIGLFQFGALEAVILNKAMSLVVVASALPFRAATVPIGEIAAHWPIVINLLAGSLLGAWVGAGWATRLKSETLYRVIAVLLVAIALVLVLGHDTTTGQTILSGAWQVIAGVLAGFVIGIVASLLGVAGGELLIPTLVLLFGADITSAHLSRASCRRDLYSGGSLAMRSWESERLLCSTAIPRRPDHAPFHKRSSN